MLVSAWKINFSLGYVVRELENMWRELECQFGAQVLLKFCSAFIKCKGTLLSDFTRPPKPLYKRLRFFPVCSIAGSTRTEGWSYSTVTLIVTALVVE